MNQRSIEFRFTMSNYTYKNFLVKWEASSVDDYLWLMGRACYKPVIEYCGGTEIVGGFITESALQPQALSAFGTPAMGCNLFILDSSGNPLPRDSVGIGELALDPTLFGSSTTLLNVDHHEAYFSGMPEWNGKAFRRHGDDLSVLQNDIIGLMGVRMTQRTLVALRLVPSRLRGSATE